MINAKDKKPADFFDIKRPAITDFVMKKTRAIKAEKAGKILNLSAWLLGIFPSFSNTNKSNNEEIALKNRVTAELYSFLSF